MDLPLTFAGVTLAGGSDTCLVADISITPLLGGGTVATVDRQALIEVPFITRVKRWPWFGEVTNLADPLLATDATEYRVEIQAMNLQGDKVGEALSGYLTCTPEGWTEPFDLLRILPVSASGPLSPVVVGPKGDPGADSTVPGPPGDDGPAGVGVSTGGTTGQVLSKVSDADFDTGWIDPATGGGATSLDDLSDVDTAGAVTGNVLGFDGTQWSPATLSGGSGLAPSHLGDLVSFALSGGVTTHPVAIISSAASTVIDGDAANQVSNAFDGNPATYWHSTNTMPQWISGHAAGAEVLVSCSITIFTFSAARSPRDFKIQGSNDGSNWTDLATFTGIVWTLGQTQTFAVSTALAYTDFRVYITGSDGGYQTMPTVLFTAASGGPFILPVGAPGEVLTVDPATPTGLKWETDLEVMLFKGNWAAGSYVPGNVVLRGGSVQLCTAATTDDPTARTARTGPSSPVDGASWTRNNCASVDTEAHVVTMINNAGGQLASVISNETFPATFPFSVNLHASTSGSADALTLGIVDSSQSSIVVGGVSNLATFYGVELDIYTNVAKGYVRGSILAGGPSYTSDSNDDTYELRFTTDSMALYTSAGVMLYSWQGINFGSMTDFKIAFAARTGGSSGAFKAYGTPMILGLSPSWKALT